MNNKKIIVNANECVGCSLCKKVCPAQNIEIHNKKADVISDKCLLCGQCYAVCPKKAITISDIEGVEKKDEFSLNPDEVLNVIRFRRTVRQFKEKEIPKEILAQILEAGNLTHTAKNMQDVSFVVLDKQKNKIERMAVNLFRKIKPVANLFSPEIKKIKITNNFFFFKAPIVIVVLADAKENGLLAAQNMEFVAEANGLGVLMSGLFTAAANMSPKIKKAMGVPKGKKVAMTLVIGYPNVKFSRSAPRKKIEVKYM